MPCRSTEEQTVTKTNGAGPTTAAGRTPDPATLPRAQRERRERIVRAAIDLLRESEYEAVQIRDVAERGGVALGTLYRYFSSKEHLYAAALVAWSSDYAPRRPADSGAETDEDRLRTMMRRAVRAFERFPQMFRAQMVIEHSTDPNARELYDEFAAQNSAALTSALRHLDPTTSVAILTTANCVMATRLRSWAHGRCTIRDVDRAVQSAIDLIFGPPPAV
jgi:AcrR family transcriptional regulator